MFVVVCEICKSRERWKKHIAVLHAALSWLQVDLGMFSLRLRLPQKKEFVESRWLQKFKHIEEETLSEATDEPKDEKKLLRKHLWLLLF